MRRRARLYCTISLYLPKFPTYRIRESFIVIRERFCIIREVLAGSWELCICQRGAADTSTETVEKRFAGTLELGPNGSSR
jgi:hypothetical protein